MKQINKNKKGFTLIEIILVVAMIVILASAFGLGVAQYLETSQAASDNVDQSVAALSDNIKTKENSLKYYGF